MEEVISVIVPVYNVEKYLFRCVDSLIKQTYKNIEIILVDDGSTDNSGSLCEECLSMDERIKVFHKENGGLSSARNFGIEHSKGELLAFIDSDDLIHPCFFEVLIRERLRNNSEIVSSDLVPFYEESEISSFDDSIGECISLKGSDILKEYFLSRNKKVNIYHGLCMKIYERQLFSDLRFEEGRLHEDLYITYKLLKKAKSFSFVLAKYYYYYKNNISSICFSFKKKNFVDKRDAFKTMIDSLYEDKDIKKPLIHFLILQYLDLISNGKRLKDFEVNKDIALIKKWIRQNISKDTYLSCIQRVIIRLMINNIKLYDVAMKIRKKAL